MTETRYRSVRPDEPLPAWVSRQTHTVVVHRRDLTQLQEAGVTNVTTLPHGGPQPGEAWVEL